MPKENAPMLPGFQYETRGRKRLSHNTKFRRWKVRFDQLRIHEFERFFSDVFSCSSLFSKSDKSRDRVYSVSIVFWAFFVQVLNEKFSCQEVVFMIKAWLVRKKPGVEVSANTAAFVKARGKLCGMLLKRIFTHTRDNINRGKEAIVSWYGHKLKVVDGSGLSMPDTKKNQLRWPQIKSQKLGCGFPLMKICAIFCLNTGIVLDWKNGNKHDSELTLWSRMWQSLAAGDLIVGDRGFCCFGAIAFLKQRSVDHIVRVARKGSIDWSNTRKIGKNQWLYKWKKPKRKSKLISQHDWDGLPDELEVRLIKHRIYENGFRSHEVFILTTLTDSAFYPADEVARVYQRRWDVEVDLRHLKTSMGMEILSCKSPEMIEKELTMYMIAYNLIMSKMITASQIKDVELSKVSFKTTVQAFQQIKHLVIGLSTKEIEKIKQQFHVDITSYTITKKKPDYIEPRAVKRRPKSRMRMNKPRQEMRQEIKDNYANENGDKKNKKSA